MLRDRRVSASTFYPRFEPLTRALKESEGQCFVGAHCAKLESTLTEELLKRADFVSDVVDFVKINERPRFDVRTQMREDVDSRGSFPALH